MYLIISILFHICKSSIRTIISILNIKACHCFPAQNTLQSADGENCCLARTTLWPVTWEHPNCTAFKKNSLETFPLFRSKQFFTVMISNIKITGLLHQTKTTGNDKIQIELASLEGKCQIHGNLTCDVLYQFSKYFFFNYSRHCLIFFD